MRVRWTESAADDLTHISDYTKETLGQAQARSTASSIFEAARSLRNLPRRGRIGRRPNTREISVAGLPFYIVYTVADTSIEILRILHSAQDRST